MHFDVQPPSAGASFARDLISSEHSFSFLTSRLTVTSLDDFSVQVSTSFFRGQEVPGTLLVSAPQVVSTAEHVLQKRIKRSHEATVTFYFFSTLVFSTFVTFLTPVFCLFFLIAYIATRIANKDGLARLISCRVLYCVRQGGLISIISDSHLACRIEQSRAYAQPDFSSQLFIAFNLDSSFHFRLKISGQSFFW